MVFNAQSEIQWLLMLDTHTGPDRLACASACKHCPILKRRYAVPKIYIGNACAHKITQVQLLLDDMSRFMAVQ